MIVNSGDLSESEFAQHQFEQMLSQTVYFTVVKEIQSLRADSLVWGNLTGASTVVSLDGGLVSSAALGLNNSNASDIRQLQFHEADGGELTLAAVSAWDDGAFVDATLDFFGTYDEAQTFAGRSLLLVHDDGRTQAVTVTSTAESFSLTGKDTVNPWMWSITLDRVPIFNRQDFDEADPKVTVYGNLVRATQGKTLAESPLGSGDGRAIFQTFALPKTPLTYLLDDTQTPAQAPELKIYVNGILWNKIETFFGAGADDQVYIVREDADGKSFVQFGDGKTGARLPSGKNNVTAVFRVGSGAYGELKADTQPQATGKLTGLDKVFLPQPVTTGAAPELEDNARAAAPGRVQSLGRLVSLADFEDETLALPNVLKANAAWAIPNGVPQVQLTVLTQSESEADLSQIQQTLATYNRARGPARFPIHVAKGLRQYLHVNLTAGFDPLRREDDIRIAIQQALGIVGAEADGVDNPRGLFGLHARRFGQSAHTSQILAVVQQLDGVVWVTLAAAQNIALGFPPATDPLSLPLPSIDAIPAPTLACADNFILALHSKHLVVNLSSAQTASVTP